MSDLYCVNLSEEERANLLIALGAFAGLVMQRGGELPSACMNLTRKIASALPLPVGKPSDEPADRKSAAVAILSPPAEITQGGVDRWASGCGLPEAIRILSVEKIQVTPDAIEPKQTPKGIPFLRVSWPNPAGRAFVFGQVWDRDLFPFIQARLNQKTVLHITRKEKFINIVGVRA